MFVTRNDEIKDNLSKMVYDLRAMERVYILMSSLVPPTFFQYRNLFGSSFRAALNRQELILPRSLTPKIRSSLPRICGLGMALLDS